MMTVVLDVVFYCLGASGCGVDGYVILSVIGLGTLGCLFGSSHRHENPVTPLWSDVSMTDSITYRRQTAPASWRRHQRQCGQKDIDTATYTASVTFSTE